MVCVGAVLVCSQALLAGAPLIQALVGVLAHCVTWGVTPFLLPPPGGVRGEVGAPPPPRLTLLFCSHPARMLALRWPELGDK